MIFRSFQNVAILKQRRLQGEPKECIPSDSERPNGRNFVLMFNLGVRSILIVIVVHGAMAIFRLPVLTAISQSAYNRLVLKASNSLFWWILKY